MGRTKLIISNTLRVSKSQIQVQFSSIHPLAPPKQETQLGQTLVQSRSTITFDPTQLYGTQAFELKFKRNQIENQFDEKSI